MDGSAAGVQADGVQQAFDERLRQALQEAYRAYDQRLETALRAAAMSANAVESALTRGHSDGESWAKHLKAPEAWKPQNREEELVQWRDFRFQLINWLAAIDSAYVSEIQTITSSVDSPREISSMAEDTRNRSYKLFSVLCGLLRGRPLALLKQFEESRNGYEGLRILFKEMEPHQRMRSLALAKELSNFARFDKTKSLHEQLIGYEDLVRQYEACSGTIYSEDLKLSTILNNTPEPLRSQLQVRITESTTYSQVREMVLQFEKLNTRWTGSNSMASSSNPYRQEEPSPMDVDQGASRVGQYPWDQGGNKGKGSKGNKGKNPKGGGKQKGSKGDGKKGKGGYNQKGGKGKDQKGKGGKNSGGPKGGGKPGNCNYCGKPGHWKNECWKRQAEGKGNVRAIPEQDATTADSSKSSALGSEMSYRSATAGSVRRVRIATPPWINTTEIFDISEQLDEFDVDYDVCTIFSGDFEPCIQAKQFDMTYSDADEEWCMDPCLVENNLDVGPGPYSLHAVNHEDFSGCIILDSGADMSVAPMSFNRHGDRSDCVCPVLRDAQGVLISAEGIRKLTLACVTSTGETVELRESFVVGNVKSPLISLGRLIKCGWKLTHSDDQICLSNGRHDIPVGMRKNTLVVNANIRAVGAEEDYEPEVFPSGVLPAGLGHFKSSWLACDARRGAGICGFGGA